MQAFKLVNGGFVDKVIVFDTLPERFTANVATKEAAGFPKAWARWLTEIGSVRPVFKTETTVDLARNWTFKNTQIGKEPCFFVLNYTDLNADKERWREICDYVKVNCGPEVRLKERIEDMAIALAPNSTSPLELETDDVMDKAYIKLPSDVIVEEKPEDLVKPEEIILVQEEAPKRRGRQKKISVEA